ncbi:hypothetical protein TRVA0_001S08482 [Trichomonascus vanleenenianus]|uniref:alpha-N-acetylglucosaminidase n=1 Tax=Trichomonascus vanleenenianus TaxID=2268995 RepID=UPI003ECAD184
MRFQWLFEKIFFAMLAQMPDVQVYDEDAPTPLLPGNQPLHMLVERHMPQFADIIDFNVDPAISEEESFTIVQSPKSKKITVSGTTKSAVVAGLYRYLEERGHVSVSWTNSTLHKLEELPPLCDESGECEVYSGSAVVPHRYFMNTVTFAYTTAFYNWKDWERLIDWAAFHGVNLPLAWVGYEHLVSETLKEFGFTEEHLGEFFSGQPYLPFNRFGNVQGNWNGTQFDFVLAKQQLLLQKDLVARMADLGMSPVLPSWAGFVPRQITELYPEANVVQSSGWNGFPEENTKTTFLDPLDPLFSEIQKKFLIKQHQQLGKVTDYFTLDQFNENTPLSTSLEYLKSVSENSLKSIKELLPDSKLIMQTWTFYYDKFWTTERVEAFLSGFTQGDVLLLDLYSEHAPQFDVNRVKGGESYYGHDWVWCQLHDFGGAQGLYGSLQVLTKDFTKARQQNGNLKGVGLAPEGLEGNQIVYDALLAQAWSTAPLDLSSYINTFIKARYGPGEVPQQLTDIWHKLVDLVYTNDQSKEVYSVPRAIYELRPALSGISDKPGIQPTRIDYNTKALALLWKELAQFAIANPEFVRESPHFHYDLVDVTRQVLANEFLAKYNEFTAYFADSPNQAGIADFGNALLDILVQVDRVLYTDKNFLLGEWIEKARKLSPGNEHPMEMLARQLVTIWGPTEELNDYAAKSWAGLVGSYHYKRWHAFFEFLSESEPVTGNIVQHWFRSLGNLVVGQKAEFKELNAEFGQEIRQFEEEWQWESWTEFEPKGDILEIFQELLDRM